MWAYAQHDECHGNIGGALCTTLEHVIPCKVLQVARCLGNMPEHFGDRFHHSQTVVQKLSFYFKSFVKLLGLVLAVQHPLNPFCW